MNAPLLKVENLVVTYRANRTLFSAVNNVSLTIQPGETLGLVGESGCGKSTVGKALLGLVPRSSGSVYFKGCELGNIRHPFLVENMQMIFQDPYSALNPRMTVEEILIEPLLINRKGTKSDLKETVEELIRSVELPRSYLKKKPYELSGGQRQRINIARAIALKPSFMFCDEPVSSLDAVHRRQIVQLLQKLQIEGGVSYLFVSHDIPLVCSISHNVAVMYFGEIVEWGEASIIQRKPAHPYTQALFSSVPIPDPKKERHRKKILLEGEVPSPINPPSGCPFHTRCPKATPLCSLKFPPTQKISHDHWIKCHFPSYTDRVSKFGFWQRESSRS